MGTACQSDLTIPDEIFNPLQLGFKRVHSVIIPPSMNKMLDSIKCIVEFPDPRKNVGLKWYHSLKYGLYLYGEIMNRKPIGQCLFYFKNFNGQSELPVIIATRVEDKNIYSKNTLLLYSDQSYYLGEIISNGIEPPIADGKGVLVSKKFIYEGDFSNGYPNGFGTYKTKGGTLVGKFVKGQPHGKCIERTKKGLFVGELVTRFRKTGKLINPQNQMEYVNEEYNSNGATLVQLE